MHLPICLYHHWLVQMTTGIEATLLLAVPVRLAKGLLTDNIIAKACVCHMALTVLKTVGHLAKRQMVQQALGRELPPALPGLQPLDLHQASLQPGKKVCTPLLRYSCYSQSLDSSFAVCLNCTI